MSFGKAMMMNMTTEELLNSLEDKRRHSPVIDILITRIEELMKGIPSADNHRSECPVCQADLIVDVDQANGLYKLRIDND